jgi:hypothetical protein
MLHGLVLFNTRKGDDTTSNWQLVLIGTGDKHMLTLKCPQAFGPKGPICVP